MARLILLGAIAGALAVAACGGSDDEQPSTATSPPPPQSLTASERRAVERMERRVQGYCRRVAEALAGTGAVPTRAQLAAVTAAIDRVAAVARAKPEATLRSGSDLRLVLGDLAENLEGTNCSRSLVEHLDRTLAMLP